MEWEHLLKIIENDPDKKLVFDLNEKIKELESIKKKMYNEILFLWKKTDFQEEEL